MIIQWYFIVICGLLSIIPAGVAVVVFVFKYVELKGIYETLLNRQNSLRDDSVKIDHEYSSLLNKISTAEAEAHKVGIKLINVEESLVSLSNKWNSRERSEKAESRRKEKEKEIDDDNEEFIDPNQQTLPLFPIPQQNQSPVNTTPNMRKFGQMPGR